MTHKTKNAFGKIETYQSICHCPSYEEPPQVLFSQGSSEHLNTGVPTRQTGIMLGSFLAGAKATIRRAGAVDQEPPSSSGISDEAAGSRAVEAAAATTPAQASSQAQTANAEGYDSPLQRSRSAGEAQERDGETRREGGVDRKTSDSITSSVSRSFSRLRVPGAAGSVVNKVRG